jgi:hypothetical protein
MRVVLLLLREGSGIKFDEPLLVLISDKIEPRFGPALRLGSVKVALPSRLD